MNPGTTDGSRPWYGRAQAGTAALIAAVVTRFGMEILPEVVGERWVRRNYRGASVTLTEGAALGAGACVGAVCAPGLSPRGRIAAALTGGTALATGTLDDLVDGDGARGFGGHVSALRERRLTTGILKLLGITAGSVAAVAVLRAERPRPGDALVDAVVIAASANLCNLLDLRPGRAAKATLLLGAPLLGRPGAPYAAATLGAVTAVLPEELGERGMFGDGGANTAGALLGLACVTGCSPRTRRTAAAVLLGLTAASERMSFSRVIDAAPPLRWIDHLGRRVLSEAGRGRWPWCAAGSGAGPRRTARCR